MGVGAHLLKKNSLCHSVKHKKKKNSKNRTCQSFLSEADHHHRQSVELLKFSYSCCSSIFFIFYLSAHGDLPTQPNKTDPLVKAIGMATIRAALLLLFIVEFFPSSSKLFSNQSDLFNSRRKIYTYMLLL